jgi:hypothetical protein
MLDKMVICHYYGREVEKKYADLVGVSLDDVELWWCGCEQEEGEEDA